MPSMTVMAPTQVPAAAVDIPTEPFEEHGDPVRDAAHGKGQHGQSKSVR